MAKRKNPELTEERRKRNKAANLRYKMRQKAIKKGKPIADRWALRTTEEVAKAISKGKRSVGHGKTNTKFDKPVTKKAATKKAATKNGATKKAKSAGRPKGSVSTAQGTVTMPLSAYHRLIGK